MGYVVLGLRLGGYTPVHGGLQAAQELISGLPAARVWIARPKPEEPAGLVMTGLPCLAWERREDHPLQERSLVGAERMAGPVSDQVELRPFQVQKGVD